MNKLVTSSLALLFALTFQARAAEPREEKTASGIGITTLKCVFRAIVTGDFAEA